MIEILLTISIALLGVLAGWSKCTVSDENALFGFKKFTKSGLGIIILIFLLTGLNAGKTVFSQKQTKRQEEENLKLIRDLNVKLEKANIETQKALLDNRAIDSEENQLIQEMQKRTYYEMEKRSYPINIIGITVSYSFPVEMVSDKIIEELFTTVKVANNLMYKIPDDIEDKIVSELKINNYSYEVVISDHHENHSIRIHLNHRDSHRGNDPFCMTRGLFVKNKEIISQEYYYFGKNGSHLTSYSQKISPLNSLLDLSESDLRFGINHSKNPEKVKPRILVFDFENVGVKSINNFTYHPSGNQNETNFWHYTFPKDMVAWIKNKN